jgi:hypothetical protein
MIKIIIKFITPLVALFLLFILLMNRNIGVYDEGLILAGAEQVLAGKNIHRDFYANYGPAQFYLISSIFKYFGNTVLNERIYDTLVKIVIIYSAYYFVRRYTSVKKSIFCASIITLYLIPLGTYGYPVYPCVALALITASILVDYVNDKNITRLIISGVLTAIITFFRYDIGFFVYLSMVLFIYYSKDFEYKISFINPKSLLISILIYSVATGLPVITLLLAYGANDMLNDFFFNVVSFPAESYSKTRGLPFPGFSDIFTRQFITDIAIYGPLLVIIGSINYLYKIKNHKSNASAETVKLELLKSHAILILISLSFFLYFKGIVRVSVTHLLISIIPSIMAAFILTSIKIPNKYINFFIITALIINIISSTVHMIGFVWSQPLVFKALTFNKIAYEKSTYPERYLNRFGNFLNGPFFLVEKNRENAYIYIQNNLNANEYFYSGLLSHEKIYINDVASYFLLDYKPATKWYHFDPDLQNNSNIQRKIVSELILNKPQFLLLDGSWDHVCEPNYSCYKRNAYELDAYINENYKLHKTFSQIQIWKKYD